MTDQSRKEQLERRLPQSIRLLWQVDDPTTRKRLHALTEALEGRRNPIRAARHLFLAEVFI
jgi:hypothetical protein